MRVVETRRAGPQLGLPLCPPCDPIKHRVLLGSLVGWKWSPRLCSICVATEGTAPCGRCGIFCPECIDSHYTEDDSGYCEVLALALALRTFCRNTYRHYERLARWLLGVCTILALALFLVCMGGKGIGYASGLRVQSYIPPNLTPSIDICEVVQVQAVDSDLFQIPN